MAERGPVLPDGKGVAVIEIAAGQDANPEGGEKTGADGVEIDDAIGHEAAIGLDGHVVGPVPPLRRANRAAAEELTAGSGANLLVEAAHQARGIGFGIAILRGSDSEREEAGGIEAGPFGEQTGERAQKQRGANEENEGEGHLEGNDRTCGGGRRRSRCRPARGAKLTRLSPPAWRAGARPLKRPAAMLATNAKASRRRLRAARTAVAARSCGRNAMSARMASGATAAPRTPPAKARSTAIREELAPDAAAGSAESEAGADLAAPCRAASQEQAGDVQASEAEQNTSGGEQ